MSKITNGIAEIKINGAVLGFTEEDSFRWITNDNTSVQNFNVEEMDDPILSTVTGSKTLQAEFKIADPDATAMSTLFDGSGSPDVTVTGISHIIKAASFAVTSKMGWGVSSTDVDISSRLSDEMGKNSLLGVIVTVTFRSGFKFVDAGNQPGPSA